MRIHSSALKHGISAANIQHALRAIVYSVPLDDEVPGRHLLLAFDDGARLLELVVLRFDSGNLLVIHAMRARPQYLDLLS